MRILRLLTSVKWDRVAIGVLGGAIFASLAFPDATLLDLAIGMILAGLVELQEVRRAR